MGKLFISLLIIFCLDNKQTEAQTLLSISSIEKVIKQRFKAVVKITVYDEKNTKVSFGGGIFIGKSGYLVTNHHIIQSFLNHKSYKISFQTNDSEYLSKVTFYGCLGKKTIDLCLFQSRPYPSYFPAKSIRTGRGHDAHLIGFCLDEKATSSQGEIIEYFADIRKNHNFRDKKFSAPIKMIQHNARQCQGDSGGPIFNHSGDLQGIATLIFKRNKKPYHYGIHVDEILYFLKEKVKEPARELKPPRLATSPLVDLQFLFKKKK